MAHAAAHTVLCRVDDIPEDGSRGFRVGDIAVFAVRRDGAVYVYRNRCPHLGIELEWVEDQFLDSDGMLIQCATHGALFVIESGECVAGPCRGDALTPVAHQIIAGEVVIEVPVDP